MGKKSSITPFESSDLNGSNTNRPPDFTGLKNNFALKEPDQIYKFLTQNPFLLPVLTETASVLERYFPDVKFQLRRYVDPEGKTLKWLILEVPTKYSPRESLDRLNRFEDEWWIDNEFKANGNLTVDVEFV